MLEFEVNEMRVKTPRQLMEWDLALAERVHALVAKSEVESGFEIDKTMERKYYEGYIHGVQNALHALDGMDADHE